jgi:hypothetical protein
MEYSSIKGSFVKCIMSGSSVLLLRIKDSNLGTRPHWVQFWRSPGMGFASFWRRECCSRGETSKGRLARDNTFRELLFGAETSSRALAFSSTESRGWSTWRWGKLPPSAQGSRILLRWVICQIALGPMAHLNAAWNRTCSTPSLPWAHLATAS